MKKFRAKPGTQRENARAIISSTPSIPAADQSSELQEPAEVWGRLDSPNNLPAPRSPAQAAAQSALENPSTEAAVKQVVEALEATDDAQAVSELYSALGTLYAWQGRFESGQVQDVFAQALDAAGSEVERIRVEFSEAKAFMQHGDEEYTLEAIRELKAKDLTDTRMRAELGVMEGMTLERTGDLKKAISSYEGVLDGGLSAGGHDDDKILNVFRQAGLRLARLYRSVGREEDAKIVAQRVRGLTN